MLQNETNIQNETQDSWCKVITKCDRSLLQSASGIKKCDRLLLESGSDITNYGRLLMISVQGPT